MSRIVWKKLAEKFFLRSMNISSYYWRRKRKSIFSYCRVNTIRNWWDRKIFKKSFFTQSFRTLWGYTPEIFQTFLVLTTSSFERSCSVINNIFKTILEHGVEFFITDQRATFKHESSFSKTGKNSIRFKTLFWACLRLTHVVFIRNSWNRREICRMLHVTNIEISCRQHFIKINRGRDYRRGLDSK